MELADHGAIGQPAAHEPPTPVEDLEGLTLIAGQLKVLFEQAMFGWERHPEQPPRRRHSRRQRRVR